MSAVKRLELAMRYRREIVAMRKRVQAVESALERMELDVMDDIEVAKQDVREAQSTHMDPHPGVRA